LGNAQSSLLYVFQNFWRIFCKFLGVSYVIGIGANHLSSVLTDFAFFRVGKKFPTFQLPTKRHPLFGRIRELPF
jgi:hypothetical protein